MHLVFDDTVSTQAGRCPNFGSVSGCLNKGDAELKLDGGGLEGGGGVDAHGVPSQVLVRSCRVERTGNLGFYNEERKEKK